MRKKNNNGKIIGVIIAVIVVFIVIGKLFISNNSTSKYMKYVSEFEKGINEYIEKDVSSGQEFIIAFDDLKQILIDKKYINDYSKSSVLLSADPITISNKDNVICFYNYKNEKTFENGLLIKFNYNEKTYTCSKNKCS